MPFAPGRMIWAVNREAALLLGAGRALLLQIAHPLVAAGVAQHSRFAREPLERLRRTLDPMYALVFGGPEERAVALEALEAAHRRVRGTLAEPAGSFARGTPYDAADPALRLWVHATLVDTSLVVYRRFVAPLSPGDEARYYEDSRDLGRLLGVPDAVAPRTLAEFRAYMAAMLSSETLSVGPGARALARLVFRPPGAPALGLAGSLLRFVTTGLLPPAMRERYGYRWSPARERMLEAAAGAVRAALPSLPERLRVIPHARAAERRLGRSGSARPAA
jgi:uncharacterized protein (DUF2236 family)